MLGATTTAECAAGYEGTASVVTCQADGTWTAASGCTIKDCGTPSQANYLFSASITTYGAVVDTECAAGYAGAQSTVTCQANGMWAAASGCSGAESNL